MKKDALRLSVVAVYLLVAAFVPASCSKKQIQQIHDDRQAFQTSDALEESAHDIREFTEPAAVDPATAGIFQDILFDYDQYRLKPEAMTVLRGIGEWLKKKPHRLLIEGHCDARGTTAYNLALGERRASSAKQFLISLGVSEKRIFTISYGEEKPLCNEHRQSCWSKNRRCHFLLAR